MKSVLISCALIITLGFIVYANSLDGEFIWDDYHLIRDNLYIRSYSNIDKIFSENMGASVGSKFNSYRPLQMLTYMFDYSLWKLDVRGYHLTNLFLHILAGFCILWLVNILFGDRPLSLFTALFFVVHPIHTEAVTYISGRAEPLAVIFMLLTFIFYIKYLHLQKMRFYILVILSYICALLSKESALILPILLLLYHYTFKKKLKLKVFLPVAGVAFVYTLLRLTLLKALLSGVSTTASASLGRRIPGFFVAITNYTRLLFFPFGLHMEYGDRLFSLIHPQALLGAAILFSLLIYATRIRNSNGLVFFSLSWFLLTLLPVSNIYPINAYMAEHWLYLPSIGFFLLLAKGLNYLYRAGKLRIYAAVLGISLLASYSYLAIGQNRYWQEPIAFYKKTLQYTPDSWRAHFNLGYIYYERGRKNEAIGAFKKAIETAPFDSGAYYNLAFIYEELGQKQQAQAVYKKAIQIDSQNLFR